MRTTWLPGLTEKNNNVVQLQRFFKQVNGY